ncbi:hypothetical protein EW146_g4317 [Bondarzewia mesenterica]|uniref:DUF6534 domain-containing protein n=1 Tax=Bondarzewia mesenterica TaxID=1095465 RepID=A0A4S4LUW1_9AGAM|nr:hypothetical protein EW146_g4317 [Bondarzewia mesenterica]
MIMASPSERVSEVVRTTFGPILLGVIVAAILYGVTSLQTIYYFDHYPQDKILLKATVAVLWIIDTLIMALDCDAVYYYSILRFGDVSALSDQTWLVPAINFDSIVQRSDLHLLNHRSMDLESILTVELFSTVFYISYLDQMFDAGLHDVSMSNVLRLSDTKVEQGILSGLQAREMDILLSAPNVQSLLTLATFATSLAITILAFSTASWNTVTTGTVHSLFVANVSLATAADFFITMVLCITLHSNRSGLQGSNIISRLMTFMITRGIITNIIQILTLITEPIYTNAVLATLNNRSRIRGRSQVISSGSAAQGSETACSQMSFRTPDLVANARVEDPTFTSHVPYSSIPGDHVGTLDLVV